MLGVGDEVRVPLDAERLRVAALDLDDPRKVLARTSRFIMEPEAYYEKLGPARYYVTVFLFLSMMSLPIKMVLRWTINLKYIVYIPEFFFNI